MLVVPMVVDNVDEVVCSDVASRLVLYVVVAIVVVGLCVEEMVVCGVGVVVLVVTVACGCSMLLT